MPLQTYRLYPVLLDTFVAFEVKLSTINIHHIAYSKFYSYHKITINWAIITCLAAAFCTLPWKASWNGLQAWKIKISSSYRKVRETKNSKTSHNPSMKNNIVTWIKISAGDKDKWQHILHNIIIIT